MAGNNLLSDKLIYTGQYDAPTLIRLCSYSPTDVITVQGSTFEEISGSISENRINWIHVCGLSNTEVVRSVGTYFNIDFLVMQDLLNANHPTKVEEHDSFMLTILKLFKFGEEDGETILERQHYSIIQGHNFVLTFSEYGCNSLNDILSAIEHNTLKIRNKQSDYLLSVLLNSAIGNYVEIISVIDDQLEDIEELLLDISASTDIGKQIQSLRRQYMGIKRTVMPLKEQYVKLLRSDSGLMHKTNRAYFNDVNDHLQFVIQHIEISRETLASLVDLYISNNDLRMNNIMKRLTIVSTIFIPLTFLVGVWGMNFEVMPETKWKYGYLMAWIVMIVVGLLVLIFFKKKKW